MNKLKNLISDSKFYPIFRELYWIVFFPFLSIILSIIKYKKRRLFSKPFENDHSRKKFLSLLEKKSKILDIGCGSNSPLNTKKILPNCYYIGIDVQDCEQEEESIASADEYIIVSPESFDLKILDFDQEIDVVISCHNLEHCNKRRKVIKNMVKVLRPGGKFFLSFPSNESQYFPGYRDGCLNYYNDKTHKLSPPDFGEVISILTEGNCRIIYANTNYQNIFEWLYGLFHENKSYTSNKVLKGTWALWGFETIIWAEKIEKKP